MLAASAAATLPAAAQAASESCGLRGPGVRLVAENAYGQVVAKDLASGMDLFRACADGSGPVYTMGRADPGYVAFESVQLAGPYLGYLLANSSAETNINVQAFVVDLRQASVVWNATRSDIEGLLITGGGAAVWASEEGVERRDARGPAIVDATPGIDRQSLALDAAGDTFYWLDSGAAFSADLQPGTTPAPPAPVRVRPGRQTCGLGGLVQTIDANRFGRVVARRTASGLSYFTCDRGGRDRLALGTSGAAQTIAQPVLSASRAAYTTTAPAGTTAYVVDVTQGRQTASLPVAGPIQLAANGAFVTTIPAAGALSVVQQYQGSQVTVDSGPGIDPSSVAVNPVGYVSYWLNAGATRSAQIG